jgi:hypothetical protein
MLSQPVLPALAAPQSLAEIIKEEYGFVDPTADGIISRYVNGHLAFKNLYLNIVGKVMASSAGVLNVS